MRCDFALALSPFGFNAAANNQDQKETRRWPPFNLT
jgi:hypothetical protein